MVSQSRPLTQLSQWHVSLRQEHFEVENTRTKADKVKGLQMDGVSTAPKKLARGPLVVSFLKEGRRKAAVEVTQYRTGSGSDRMLRSTHQTIVKAFVECQHPVATAPGSVLLFVYWSEGAQRTS